MVALSEKSRSSIDTIKVLLSAVSDTIKIFFEEDEYEYRIDVVPSSKEYCCFMVCFSSYDTYDLHFGNGLRFEDIAIDKFKVDDIINMILLGRVCETITTIFGVHIKTVGEVKNSADVVLKDANLSLFSFLSVLKWAKSQKVLYQPYPTK